MNQNWVIADVLASLRPGDLRKDWWVKVGQHIQNRNFPTVLNMLKDHHCDSDFADQMIIVGNSIRKVS